VAIIRPFRALRPQPERAQEVASVPYDVVNTDEARALAEGNPFSFQHVSRPEIDLPPDTDIHSDVVYRKAVENFEKLIATAPLEKENEPSLYLYRLIMGDHEQIGVVACASIDEYDDGTIRKHERTRRDKEDDRTRHMLMLKAQTGPVFLTYRARPEIDEQVSAAINAEPLFDLTAPDGVRHTIWRLSETESLVKSFESVPLLYIADGHHRAASAARARVEMRQRGSSGTFLAVAFPDNRVRILPYNRIVKDLGELSAADFLQAVRARFEVEKGPAMPAARGEIAMYFQGGWHTLRALGPPDRAAAIAALDVSVLQDRLLAPVLKITDVRTDARIEFVGGARGTDELERLVDSGRAAAAFSLFPVAVDDLMAVSDAGAIMPPKSTWFEPKLRDGLLIHVI